MPPRFWAYAALFIGAGIIYWWRTEVGEVQTLRDDLMARQRTVEKDLGPRWFPLRDKIEQWVQECGTRTELEHIDQETLSGWDFRGMRGIYLRLGIDDAVNLDRLREATQRSLHDGFTACLLVAPNPSPLAGPACQTTRDCQRGHFCNEMKHCSEYSQPYNLRIAYQTMRVLTPEWVQDVQQITAKLTLRGAVATFDAINEYDIPIAVDLLQRSKYFMVVVDEKAPEGSEPEPVLDDEVDPEAGVRFDPSIPTAPHKARVCVWRLEDDKQVLAIRRDAAGALVGGRAATSVSSEVARQRQANSCALALSVREAMGIDTATKAP